jgi:hypothetical protein
MMQFLMSRLQASAISWSSFSACRNSRGLPTETARVNRRLPDQLHTSSLLWDFTYLCWNLTINHH